MEIEYTKEQVRAAKRAAKALKELADSGLYLIWHASSGYIAIHLQKMYRIEGTAMMYLSVVIFTKVATGKLK